MRIFLNGRECMIDAEAITYRQIAREVGLHLPTVTFHCRMTNEGGGLEDGDVIALSDGLVITAIPSGAE